MMVNSDYLDDLEISIIMAIPKLAGWFLWTGKSLDKNGWRKWGSPQGLRKPPFLIVLHTPFHYIIPLIIHEFQWNYHSLMEKKPLDLHSSSGTTHHEFSKFHGKNSSTGTIWLIGISFKGPLKGSTGWAKTRLHFCCFQPWNGTTVACPILLGSLLVKSSFKPHSILFFLVQFPFLLPLIQPHPMIVIYSVVCQVSHKSYNGDLVNTQTIQLFDPTLRMSDESMAILHGFYCRSFYTPLTRAGPQQDCTNFDLQAHPRGWPVCVYMIF